MDSICISKGKNVSLPALVSATPVGFWGPDEVVDTIAGADMRPYLNE